MRQNSRAGSGVGQTQVVPRKKDAEGSLGGGDPSRRTNSRGGSTHRSSQILHWLPSEDGEEAKLSISWPALKTRYQ